MLVQILTACAPILVALIGIIPTVVANRKKTEKSIADSNRAMKQRVDRIRKTLSTGAPRRAPTEESGRQDREPYPVRLLIPLFKFHFPLLLIMTGEPSPCHMTGELFPCHTNKGCEIYE